MNLTKEELFKESMEREGIVPSVRRNIPKLTGPREGLASFAQKRIWVSQLLEQDSTVYNILLALQIDGPLSLSAVEQGLQTIVDRHEALRTYFKATKGRPYQIVAPHVRVRLPLADLSHLAFHGHALERVLAFEQRTPFRLEKGPLFRFSILRLSPSSNVLLIALHHIIFDFVSSQILLGEFQALYDAYSKGVPLRLKPLKVQYLDFSYWQEKQFDETASAPALQYWKETIGTGEAVPILELPSDRPSGEGRRFEPASERFQISEELCRKIRMLAAKEKTTNFCVFVTAFQILLHRYTDAEDILVCVPHSERSHPDLENVLGFFINLVVLKLKIKGGKSFRELLRELHQTYLDSIETRSYPFDKLVEALAPSRYQGLARLGQVGFGYQKSAQARWKIGELEISFLEVNVPIAKTDLSISVYESPTEAKAYVEYNAALFSKALIQRMVGHYLQILDNLVDFLNLPIQSVPYLTPPELPRVNVRALEEPQDREQKRTAQAAFEALARKQPDKIALWVNGQGISYRALDRRANQVARTLRASGVSTGRAVGLLTGRTTETYVFILAILKSGGTYVPMDRNHPAAYLRKITETAEVGHVIVSSSALGEGEASTLGGAVRLAAAELFARSEGEDTSAVAAEIAPEQPAYVCFTSGSSGESKGTYVTHRAFAAHVPSFFRSFPLSNDDRVMQFASLTFDVSLEQIFSAWNLGATLVPRGDTIWGIREFLEIVRDEQLTSVNLPTAYWNQVVKACTGSELVFPSGTLRTMIVGGEAMLAETARLWHTPATAQIELVNAYGPTEAVITASLQTVDFSALNGLNALSIPIGQPLSGRQAYVLDKYGMPTPIGIPGELCLAGVALGGGYLKNPRATALQFRPDGFILADDRASGMGSRMYCTGDWVRRLPNGALEFLQRKDDEIKIRGMRVRPSLIESALLENEHVLEAVVVMRERETGPSDSTNIIPSNETDLSPTWLARFPARLIEKTIAEIEELRSLRNAAEKEASPEKASDSLLIQRREPEFELSFHLTSGNFIAPPRPAQRNWLINRALDEWVQDLRALDSLAARFVPGAERQEIERNLATAEVKLDSHDLVIDGQQVMQDWQKSLMRELAKIVSERNGDILEIGFGMGISASYIQEFGVRSHTIIEANENVVEAANRWKKRYPGKDIRILNSRWEDVVEDLEPVDGVLFDTFPMTEAEFRKHVLSDITFAEHFFPCAWKLLREGGVFTYYSNEIDSLSRRHQRLLLKTFSSFQVGVVDDLKPPLDNQNWWADSMVTIRAYKH